MRLRVSSRRRAFLLVTLSLVAFCCLSVVFLTPILERTLHERLVAAAARRGFLLQIDEIRVRALRGLRISGILLERPGVRIQARNIDLGLSPWGSGWIGPVIRVHAAEVVALLPGRSRLRLAPTTWDVRVGPRAVRARIRRHGERLEIEWRGGDSPELQCRASRLRASELVEARFRELLEIRPGIIGGSARLRKLGHDALRLVAEIQSHGARLSGLAHDGSSVVDDDAFGAPTDADLRLAVVRRFITGDVILERIHLSAAGTKLVGRATIRGGTRDPRIDLDLDVERVDFNRLLATAGLSPPVGANDLGAAALGAHVVGRVADPRSFRVEQRLDFTPPRAPIPALVRLRGPFTHNVVTATGRRLRIDVSPESPDFIPIEEVSPLFIRALLLSEDTNFHGHHGIDLSEVPVALVTNWKRGTTARGASTITQQLAKNLFLSREKSVSRKLQELAIALLIESALTKQRILEIYLNIIEWGPELYGLRPAALHYFDAPPEDLTPKQMAFLVALIPGPIKYQRSLRNGAPSPAFESLIIGVLDKLRSVEALPEEEYQEALFEPIVLRQSGPAWNAQPRTTDTIRTD